MSRVARLVVPGYPHHVTQRGGRGQQTFFRDSDYEMYKKLVIAAKATAGVEIWAYCLMPNHVHLIVVPKFSASLGQLFRTVHAEYARRINKREGWQGHLWQERFHSFVMDESHLLAAARYVELNPVRAKLCNSAQEWKWSSARAHLNGKDDGLVLVTPLMNRVSDWSRFLCGRVADETLNELRQHSVNGLPLGDSEFVGKLEVRAGRSLRRRKPGPKIIK